MAIGTAFMAAFDQVSAAFAEHSETFDTIINIGMMVAEIFGSVIIAAIITFANIAVGVITTTIGVIVDIINGLVGVLTGIITFITDVFACDWTLAQGGRNSRRRQGCGRYVPFHRRARRRRTCHECTADFDHVEFQRGYRAGEG